MTREGDTTTERTDEALMQAYQMGDQQAFRVLFDRYAPRLMRLMQRQISNTDDARDLVQQTFLQLHRARNDFREGAPLRPWIYTIALNLRRSYFRRARVHQPLDLDAPDPQPLPEHMLERRQVAAQVRAALEQLPESQRRVIELHWLEGMMFPEVARSVDASVSAVKVRAHRGYKRLRKILGGANLSVVVAMFGILLSLLLCITPL